MEFVCLWDHKDGVSHPEYPVCGTRLRSRRPTPVNCISSGCSPSKEHAFSRAHGAPAYPCSPGLTRFLRCKVGLGFRRAYGGRKILRNTVPTPFPLGKIRFPCSFHMPVGCYEVIGAHPYPAAFQRTCIFLRPRRPCLPWRLRTHEVPKAQGWAGVPSRIRRPGILRNTVPTPFP